MPAPLEPHVRMGIELSSWHLPVRTPLPEAVDDARKDRCTVAVVRLRGARVNRPPRSFAATFARLVGPALGRMCEIQGLLVALDLVPFYEAEGRVMRHALSRGAAHFDDDQIADLADQIAVSILEAVDQVEPAIAEGAGLARRMAKLHAA